MGLFSGRKRRTWATAEELAKQQRDIVAGKRQQLLDEFKEKSPQYQSQLEGQARSQFANQMNQDLSSLNRNASARGMLESGMRAKNEGSIRGGAALGFASEKDAIAKRMKDYIENTQTDIRNQQLGMQTQGLMQDADSVYKNMQQSAASGANAGQLMQGVGYALGSVGGSKDTTTTTQNNYKNVVDPWNARANQYLSGGNLRFE